MLIVQAFSSLASLGRLSKANAAALRQKVGGWVGSQDLEAARPRAILDVIQAASELRFEGGIGNAPPSTKPQECSRCSYMTSQAQTCPISNLSPSPLSPLPLLPPFPPLALLLPPAQSLLTAEHACKRDEDSSTTEREKTVFCPISGRSPWRLEPFPGAVANCIRA